MTTKRIGEFNVTIIDGGRNAIISQGSYRNDFNSVTMGHEPLRSGFEEMYLTQKQWKKIDSFMAYIHPDKDKVCEYDSSTQLEEMGTYL